VEIKFSYDITAKGPVVEGTTAPIMDAYDRRVTDVLGDLAVQLIKAYLPTQYMYLGMNGGSPRFNPIPANAGTYQSGIHTDRVSDDVNLVHDTPVVYGPWLEGVGSRNPIVWPHHRNPPPRRFPGYHTFRKMAQVVNVHKYDIAERELQPFIRTLNGD
jgi:hypothetical protein